MTPTSPTDEQWDVARQAWAARASSRTIAALGGVHATTVSRRARRDGWERTHPPTPPTEYVSGLDGRLSAAGLPPSRVPVVNLPRSARRVANEAAHGAAEYLAAVVESRTVVDGLLAGPGLDPDLRARLEALLPKLAASEAAWRDEVERASNQDDL